MPAAGRQSGPAIALGDGVEASARVEKRDDVGASRIQDVELRLGQNASEIRGDHDARGATRDVELAIRVSIGAGRRRLFRQLLTESLLLSIAGALIGVLLAYVSLDSLVALIPLSLPANSPVGVNGTVLAFALGLTIATALLFGLVPAWQATELAPARALGSDTRTTTGRGGRIRSVLVGAEVATAVVLLFGAGLLLRTLMAVEGVDRGYRANGVLTMIVDPLGEKYPTPESLLQFYDAIEQEIRALPGVLHAQPNYRRSAIQTAPPNDPLWLDGSLWGLLKIQAQPAWNGFTSGDGSVVVADIDTGVNYDHPDLAANVWSAPEFDAR